MCSIDQLICEYYNCTNEAHCVYGYEVCNENPFFGGDDYYVCMAAFYLFGDKPFKGCFIVEHGCSDTCVLVEYPKDYYSCICNSTLCNSNNNLIVPYHTSVIQPTGYNTYMIVYCLAIVVYCMNLMQLAILIQIKYLNLTSWQ